MYENVRAIIWGLILSVGYMTITAVVVVIDPFNNGVPWVNWLVLSVVMVASVIAATFVVISTNNDGDFYGSIGVLVLIWLMFGGMIAGMFHDGIRPEYRSLVWSAFAVPLITLPIAGLVQYLVGAAAHARQQSSSNLRQVA